MSTIKVDTIATRTGSGNITLSNNVASLTSAGAISGTNITASGTLGVTGITTLDNRMNINFNGSATQAMHLKDTGGGNLASFGLYYNPSNTLIGNIQNANNTGIHLNVGTNGSVVFDQTGYTAANSLDDYEEGTWTPSVAGNTTYDNQVGRYVKIGNQVTLWFYIQINQRNSPGVPYIAGTSPFTNSSAITGSGLVHYFEGIQTNAVVLTARIDPGGSNINISGSTGSGATTANVNHDWVKNGGDIYGFVTHFTG